ncbi:MAG: hypothetical protein WB760_23370 [Xanthobacteraceae bacterium]
MSKSNEAIRQELLQARAKLLRQIDILQAMPQSDIFRTEEVEAAPPTPLPDLRAELKQIEDALADLGEDDA